MFRLFPNKVIFAFSLLILATGASLTVSSEFFSNSAMAGEVMPPRETPVNEQRTVEKERFKKKSPGGRRGFSRPNAGFTINIEINRNRQNVKKNKSKKKLTKLQELKIKTAKNAKTAIKIIAKKRKPSKGFDDRAIYKEYGIDKIDRAIVKVGRLIIKDAKALKKKPSRKMKSTFKKRVRQLYKTDRALKRIRRAITKNVSKMKSRKSYNKKYFKKLKNYKKVLRKLQADLKRIYDSYRKAIKAGIK